MNCKDFWKKFEESGLTPQLEKHINECKSCKNEMEIEVLLNKKVKNLYEFEAPDNLWEKIEISVLEKDKVSLLERIKKSIIKQFPAIKLIPLKPAFAGAVILLLFAVGFRYYLKSTSHEEKVRLQTLAIDEIEKKENEYIAAIEKFSKLLENSEKNIDPELSWLYQEKLAALDEFISQCKEALEENEYNIDARKYLAMAYKEKVETLQKMYENPSFF